MGLQIQGYSNVVAEVNADRELAVATTLDEAKAGFSAALSEVDAGTVTGERTTRAFEASEDYRERVGIDSLRWNDRFVGAVLNSTLWTAPVTTATVTVAAGWLNLNAGASVASGAVARVTSYSSFPSYGTVPLYWESVIQFTQLPQTNNVCEWGEFISTGVAAPTDGCFFRLDAAGEFRCVTSANGVEQQSAALDFSTLVGSVNSHHYLVVINDDSASFWIDDVLVARVLRATAGYGVTASGELPASFRNYNTAITAAAQIVKIAYCTVTYGDINTGKSWLDTLACMGGNATQGQTGGTLGTTALYTNSLAAGAGFVATNTTAALGSGLGGQFSLQPTLAVPTDGIIQSYLNPLGTAAIPGRTLMIKGVRISAVVTTLFVGGPVILALSLAYGHTAVSLATTETATSKAPRRIPLGIMTFAATAAVGAGADKGDIYIPFTVAVVVQPGEFLQVVGKNMGVVTSAGVITFEILFDPAAE